MGRKNEPGSKPVTTRLNRRAIDPEAREKQLCNLAVNEAERQLRAGTASSQIICHYLKLATAREDLEKEKLAEENKLLKAKTKALEASTETSAKYVEVINAFKLYSGHGDKEE